MGARPAPGKATPGGCGPRRGERQRLRGLITARRRDLLLWEPARWPGEGRSPVRRIEGAGRAERAAGSGRDAHPPAKR